jgi:ribosomal protein S27AE
MYKKIILNGSAQEAYRAEIKEKLRAHDRVCPRCHTDEWTDFIKEVDNRVWEPKVMAEFGHIYKIYKCTRCGAQWEIYPNNIDEAVDALYKLEVERGEELLSYDYDMEI